MKDFKYKKQIFFGISLTLFLCALISVILFFVFSNKTVETSSNDTTNIIMNDKIEQSIPNVTKENTKFKISETKKKVESVNISASNRLSEYNLYYLLVFENTNTSKTKNEDYLIFNDLLLILDENCTIYFKYELDGNYSNEVYKIKISNIKIPEKEKEKATEKELKEQKVDKKDTSQATSPYFIKVNYGANVVTIYTKDSDGNYTVPYKAMVCSCGTYTPKNGTYKTSNKYTWRLLINNVYGQYATRIVGSILFHSVPYTSNKKDTLEYWEYDKLGQTASAGCVRLTVRDAKWIYDNCPRGTMVEFYSSSNPGPLGKPSAQKISSVEECRNWDPTDNVTENPWHTYNSKKEENNNNINNAINNSITNNINNSVMDNSISSNATNSSNLNNNILNNVANNTVNNSTNNGSSNSNVNINTSTNSDIDNTTTNSNITNSISNNTTNSYQNNTVVNNSMANTSTTNTVTNSSTNNTVVNNKTEDKVTSNTTNNITNITDNTTVNSNNSNSNENNNSNNSVNNISVNLTVNNTIQS